MFVFLLIFKDFYTKHFAVMLLKKTTRFDWIKLCAFLHRLALLNDFAVLASLEKAT